MGLLLFLIILTLLKKLNNLFYFMYGKVEVEDILMTHHTIKFITGQTPLY